MSLSARQAAEQVGMTKQGVINAIKDGRISATKNNKGQWEIEASELFRVFPSIKLLDTLDSQNTLQSGLNLTNNFDAALHLEQIKLQLELEVARKEIKSLESRNSDLQQERDDWKDQAKKLLLQAPGKPVERQKGFLGISSRKNG